MLSDVTWIDASWDDHFTMDALKKPDKDQFQVCVK
jgi:hypothetical protein